MISDSAAIGALIKSARKKAGMTQSELGSLIGTPQAHLSKIESGKTDMHVSTLIEIARSLGSEVTLIPQKHLHAVRAITRSGNVSARSSDKSDTTPAFSSSEPTAAYTLDDDDD